MCDWNYVFDLQVVKSVVFLIRNALADEDTTRRGDGQVTSNAWRMNG